MTSEEDLRIKEGVYFHNKKGFAIVIQKSSGIWVIDKDKRKMHPFFRGTIGVVENLTGEYFWKKSLKDYEYIGEYK